MKYLFLLFTPLSIFASFLIRDIEKKPITEIEKTASSALNRVYIKAGPAGTIYAKSRIRPMMGISYQKALPKNLPLTAINITLSYSYNNVERPKRSYSIGEIFLPKIKGITYITPNSDSSLFAGIGTGLMTSWQTESHANSPSLLSSCDDDINNINSFFFFGPLANFSLGYEIHRFKEISSGIELEVNIPLFPVSYSNTRKRIPPSIEISFFAGF